MSMLTGVIKGAVGSLPGGPAAIAGFQGIQSLFHHPGTPAGNIPEGQGGTAIGFHIPGFGFGITQTGGGQHGAVNPGQGGACPKGYHLNKHPLPACKSHKQVPSHSLCVRNRYLNPMNGRAVARAARRIHRGEKLLRKIFQVEGKHHGRIRPKTHTKAK